MRLKKQTLTVMLCLFAIILAILTWCACLYWSIGVTGEKTVPQPADVIIVLGAAVWPHGPSPALQARLQHAAELYFQGYANYIILSGGLGIHPPTEAEAMQVAMLHLGIEDHVMYLEKEATNTIENLKYSKNIMDENNWKTAIIVSDVFHIKRALLIAGDQGIVASGAPAKNSVLYQNRDLRISNTIREVLALSRYYIVRWFIREKNPIVQGLHPGAVAGLPASLYL